MKKTLILLVIVLVGIQFIPVDRKNPPIRMDINAPDNIASILRTSCYDCHSNETNWQWYSYIAPVSFLVASDVKKGREHLNFSEWDKYDENKREKILEEVMEEVERGEMPLSKYTITHPDAKLDSVKIQMLEDWVTQENGTKKSLRYDKKREDD